jgi:hypothetical protein
LEESKFGKQDITFQVQGLGHQVLLSYGSTAFNSCTAPPRANFAAQARQGSIAVLCLNRVLPRAQLPQRALQRRDVAARHGVHGVLRVARRLLHLGVAAQVDPLKANFETSFFTL